MYLAFCNDHSDEFTAIGFNIRDLIKIDLDRSPVQLKLNAITARLTDLEQRIDGKPAAEGAPAVAAMAAQIKACEELISQANATLAAPQRAFQAYLKQLGDRKKQREAIEGDEATPDTIRFLEAKIRYVKDELPDKWKTQKEERKELVRKLHQELLQMKGIYEDLYAPVQRVAVEAATSTHLMPLQFNAAIADSGFAANFLDFIHRNRKGNFYGDDESRVVINALMQGVDLNSTEEVIGFIGRVLDKLTRFERDGTTETISISAQLREKKKVSDLYDFLFGLDYLEIRYNLRLGDKDILKLSPGEKGALLLVFYLLLDVDEIPIIIDQSEHNLDNESVVNLLVECIRKARARRQVFIVTHNSNLAIYCDADQIVCCKIDKADRHVITYDCGAIEDYPVNTFAVKVLEGSYDAFANRGRKIQKPRS
jgi:hypothetical protein